MNTENKHIELMYSYQFGQNTLFEPVSSFLTNINGEPKSVILNAAHYQLFMQA